MNVLNANLCMICNMFGTVVFELMIIVSKMLVIYMYSVEGFMWIWLYPSIYMGLLHGIYTWCMFLCALEITKICTTLFNSFADKQADYNNYNTSSNK